MPIYEFFCDNCQKKSEVMQKISDPYPETCPQCGKGPFRKLISQTAFVLKGGGWYSEGYAQSNKGGPKSSEGSSAAEGSKSTTEAAKPAATESKPTTPSSGSSGSSS